MPFVAGPHTGITNPRWRTAAILEKLKNRHISAAVQPILTQFGMMMNFEPLDRRDRQKFEILQIQDGGVRHLENLKIVISQPRFARFRRNLVLWCSSTLLGVPTVTNFKFQKSKMTAAVILKNWKITISRPRFNRFWRNLARWCISNLCELGYGADTMFHRTYFLLEWKSLHIVRRFITLLVGLLASKWRVYGHETNLLHHSLPT